MNELPGVLTAAAAGLLSFLSPCVLPLIPSYLTVLTGGTLAELRAGESAPALRRLVLARSLAFSIGFTAVFVALGFVLSSSAAMLGGASRFWGRVAGAAIIVLGLNVAFDFIKVLNFEKRFHSAKRPAGTIGAFAFGAAFAAGWSPCVGPILASILLLAGQGTSGRAALLLAAYSTGLALPFIAVGIFFGSLEPVVKAMAARMKIIKLASGLFLGLIGVSMLAGSFQNVNVVISSIGYSARDFAASSPAAARTIFSVIYGLGAAVSAAAAWMGSKRKGKSLFRWSAAVPFALFAVLCAAEAAGLFSSLATLAAWLLYQGI